MKRRKKRENSINSIVYVHYMAFDEGLLMIGKKVERIWMLRKRSTVK